MRYAWSTVAIIVFAEIALTSASATAADSKKVVFLAGPRSHGYGSHEHHAGCLLLAKCLKAALPEVETVVVKNGWPKNDDVLSGADAIVIFSDGGGRHPINAHLDLIDKLMKKGVGLSCLHYAVEVPKGRSGDYFKEWIGGYFETFWSVNPHWRADFKTFPNHPAARGLKPFAIDDEWYYHMRFRDKLQGVTPILSAVPPEATRHGKDGARSGNPAVRARAGMIEHVAWVCQREDGGRGFGFSGGHWHWNWGNDNFRMAALNGIAWTAGLKIPANGLRSPTPTFAELEADLDEPKPAKFNGSRWLKTYQEWNGQR